MVPLVIGAVRMTSQVLSGKPLSEMMNWVGLILCFDILYIGVAIMTIDHILEE